MAEKKEIAPHDNHNSHHLHHHHHHYHHHHHHHHHPTVSSRHPQYPQYKKISFFLSGILLFCFSPSDIDGSGQQGMEEYARSAAPACRGFKISEFLSPNFPRNEQFEIG